ncbi:M61 family peptidase [Marinilongibacter aquaticus]|uniref:M61 family metallopeptidase n=1 Tax=Marinilongibacter aquaticus TaxID=2975157 RepID=UPI0021BD4BEC|nr:M61 family peptidase [Marinilongibacter aquaticus]UBM58316.1 M61 family peptidase [Marinilongibacter aquaticus]
MNYKINWPDRTQKYLEIEVSFENIKSTKQEIQLPAWRPGRYELQNFAQYIRKVRAFDANRQEIPISKINKDRWQIESQGHSACSVRYEFYADMQNAGGSFVDSGFFYLNPVNCCMYIDEKVNEACSLTVDFTANRQIASGMAHQKSGSLSTFKAKNFHDLVDSPIMISDQIQHKTYNIGKHDFHVWIKGKVEIDWDRLLDDFKKFTQVQIELFQEFPEPEYHFMLWMLPHSFYHGVEHRNSTMMTLGPDGQDFDQFYTDLLCLASHELFHTWNVKKIRPIELLPYDYSKENYFETCFVAEGLTTLYGDWILHRAGVLSRDQFIKEFGTTIKRHFEGADEASESLASSSYDLWLDGYKKSVPNRTASVYNKGALAGLILHSLILEQSQGEKGLDQVMQTLWARFGKPFVGYSSQDYIALCEEVANTPLDTYFQDIIYGNKSIWDETQKALSHWNLEVQKNEEGHVVLVDLEARK